MLVNHCSSIFQVRVESNLQLALRAEVHAVVQLASPRDGDELITELTDLGVHNKTLKIKMSKASNGETGGIVAATGLETDETVLNDIDTADTVVVADLVEELEELNGASGLLAINDDLDGDTLLEVDGELLGSVGGVLGVNGAGPELLGGSVVGVLKDTGLVGAVDEVVIHGPGGLGGRGDGNVLVGGVLEEILTALEAGAELGKSPGSNDLDLGVAGPVVPCQCLNGFERRWRGGDLLT